MSCKHTQDQSVLLKDKKYYIRIQMYVRSKCHHVSLEHLLIPKYKDGGLVSISFERQTDKVHI